MTDRYEDDTRVPLDLEQYGGPQGVALVRAWKDGTTDPGWGLWRPGAGGETTGFMWKYEHLVFRAAPIANGFSQGRWNFAFVMRALRLVCIDIDGKNGGLSHAGRLGMLPPTLAETSKHSQAAAARTSTITKTVMTQDPEEVLLMHDALLDDLKKPIPAGRRNNTLFAIGVQLRLALVPDWDQLLFVRALDVGLDHEEARKLVSNVERYGDQ
jgi:hypothetical protein